MQKNFEFPRKPQETKAAVRYGVPLLHQIERRFHCVHNGFRLMFIEFRLEVLKKKFKKSANLEISSKKKKKFSFTFRKFTKKKFLLLKNNFKADLNFLSRNLSKKNKKKPQK